jgi:hypothetical protein
MAVDLRSVISDDRAIKTGGFSGAIFLSYSLNLAFYEQIIAPALDQAGCSNALILVDPDGYNAALEMGAKRIGGAGLRYVVTPIIRRRGGIQHVKLLLMAGPRYGRLLVGSGNLTLHGFSRNLELFSHFEFIYGESSEHERYPFAQAWGLVERLELEGQLPTTAQTQITALRENAPWMSSDSREPAEFRLV